MLTKLRPMLLPHSPLALKDLRTGTVNDPLRILVSGCIMGWPVTTDGTDAGLGGSLQALFALPNVVAVQTHMSAACGSQVISDGCRLVPDRTYQRGVGVATAMVLRAGIPVLSARDYKTLYAIMRRHNDALPHRDDLRDHHETDSYVSYFGDTSSST